MSTLKNALFIVLIFNLFTFFFLFSYNIAKDVSDDYIINITYNETLTMMNNKTLNVSNDMISFIESSRDKYYNTVLPVDLFFLLFWINAFIVTVIIASLSRKKSIFSFLGLVTMGVIIILFVSIFVNQIVTWLFENFYTNFFNLTNVNTPIADYYIANFQVINFAWMMLLILINQIDFDWVIGRTEGRFSP